MDTFEKKYKEALERAKELLLGNEHSNTIRSYFEHIFPELAESDEKIRKDLIYDIERLPMQGVLTHRPTSEYIAYLEKQKEQKPPVDVDPCDASWYAYYQRGLNKGYELGLDSEPDQDMAQEKWKPIPEQLEAMEFVIRDYREDGCTATANYLQEIYEQIKKL